MHNIDRTNVTQRYIRASALWVVVAGVVLSAWLFGSSDPWTALLISQICLIGLGLWLFSVVAAPSPRIVAPGLIVPLLVLLAYTGLQCMPLGAGLQTLLNPFVAETSSGGTAILMTAPLDMSVDVESLIHEQRALSLAPAATRRAFALLLVYVSVFIVIVNTGTRWSRVWRIATVLVSSGFLLAVVSVAHKFSGSSEILWFHQPRYGSSIFGPFSNRNHFAAYMNMLTGVGLGLLLASRHFRDVIGWPHWRDRLAMMSTKRASQVVLSGFAIVLFGAAVCISLSRGGILSLVIALVVICLRGGGSPATRRALRTTGVILILGLLTLVLWLGSAPVIDRLISLSAPLRDPMQDERAIITLDTLRVAWRCPIFGTGFGTYRHIFSMFQTPPLAYRWLHAHNDWAQLLAEGGLLGLGAFAAALIIWLRHLAMHFNKAASRGRFMAQGLLFGLLTIATHSLVDYSLHKPANALLLVTLAALAVCAVHTRHRNDDHITIAVWRGRGPRLAALIALIGLTFVFQTQNRELRGALGIARFNYFARVLTDIPDSASLYATAKSAEDEADIVFSAHNYHADELCELTAAFVTLVGEPRLDYDYRIHLARRAASLAALATVQAPTDYITWLWLARTQLLLGRWDAAETAIERARRLVSHPDQVRMFPQVELEDAEAESFLGPNTKTLSTPLAP